MMATEKTVEVVTFDTVADSLKDLAKATTICPRCESKPGQSCVTISGKKTKMHSNRWAPLAYAYYMDRP